MSGLYIFGASAYATLVAHYFQAEQQTVKAFLVDKQYLTKNMLGNSVPVIALENFQQEFEASSTAIFIAIGYRRMRQRKELFTRITKLGTTQPNLICKGALVDSTVLLGVNNVIMPGAVIEPGVVIGDNNIIWSNCTICHDVNIGSHNFLAANCTIGGHSVLGDLCFLGFSSTVAQNCVLGDEVLLAAMSFLNRNGIAHSCYGGIPAKVLKEHQQTGIEIK